MLFFTGTPRKSPKKRAQPKKTKECLSKVAEPKKTKESFSQARDSSTSNTSLPGNQSEDIMVAPLVMRPDKKDKKGNEIPTAVIHYCFFCGKAQKKITRHWYEMHPKMHEVKVILDFPMNPDKKDEKIKAERSKKIQLLKNKGDFRYVNFPISYLTFI